MQACISDLRQCSLMCIFTFLCKENTEKGICVEESKGVITDYGRPMKPFIIEIQNFWAWADKLGIISTKKN